MLKKLKLSVAKAEVQKYSLFLKLPLRSFIDLRDPVFRTLTNIESDDLYLCKYIDLQEANPSHKPDSDDDDELMQIESLEMPFALQITNSDEEERKESEEDSDSPIYSLSHFNIEELDSDEVFDAESYQEELKTDVSKYVK